MSAEIPEDILNEIENDVQRYRTVRINAAKKRFSPEFQAKLARRAEYSWIRSSDGKAKIVEQFANGKSFAQIAANYSSVSEALIKKTVSDWLWDRLNPIISDMDSLVRMPRYSDLSWRSALKGLQNAGPDKPKA